MCDLPCGVCYWLRPTDYLAESSVNSIMISGRWFQSLTFTKYSQNFAKSQPGIL